MNKDDVMVVIPCSNFILESTGIVHAWIASIPKWPLLFSIFHVLDLIKLL